MLDIRHVVGAVLLFIDGMWEMFSSCRDGLEFEEGMHRLWQKAGGQLYAWSLERMDQRLMQSRDRSELKVVGFRVRTIISSFGEVRIKRRLYQDSDGDYVFLLDRTMGWSRRSRLTLRMKQMGVVLSADMPFRRVARAMEYLAPGVSAMAVWKEVQEAGELARSEAEVRRDLMFEKGEYTPGDKVAETLYLEADGVHIRQQYCGKQARSLEVRMATIYDGKEELASGKKRLTGRQTVAGVVSGPDLWERASERASSHWDLNQVREVHVGGDGASWIKKGTEMFPGAQFHLDPFHIKRAMTRALSFDDDHYQSVARAVADLDADGVEKGLQDALESTRDTKKIKHIRELGRYLRNNWEGIGRLSPGSRMGVIEAQVRHVIARRMKHLSGGWSPSGTDNMVHLLAAESNGELKRYVPGREMDRDRIDDVIGSKPLQAPSKKQSSGEDIEEWLRVNMPALSGPHSDRPWVKHVLREISKAWGAA